MQICRPLPHLSPQELRTIAEKDCARNYSGSGHTVEELLAAVQEWKESGYPIGFYEDIIFIGRSVGGSVFEFHSMNGGTLRDLIRGTRMLLEDAASRYNFAVTYYNNPRVEGFAKHFHYPFRTAEVCQGPDRRYATTFDLRR
jgi:hypothetical protein